MKFGVTINIGNFNSMRVESSDHETIKECYGEILAILINWVEDFNSINWWIDKLIEKREKLRG